MLDLCIAEMDWLCLDSSMQKLTGVFVCLFCFRTDTSVCLSRFCHSLLFLVKHHSSSPTGHGTCWVLDDMERGERHMDLLLHCGLSSSMTTPGDSHNSELAIAGAVSAGKASSWLK